MRIEVGSIERDGHECGELVKDYYKRTIAARGMKPLSFKWDLYKQLEDGGNCKLFVVRDEDEIIGFSTYVIQPHLHHDDHVVAQCTMIGVSPEWRKMGIATDLISFVENRMKHWGVTHLVHYHRTIYKDTPLFEKLGFKLIELSYVKEL